MLALPPTKEAFKKNIYLADLQAGIWRVALDIDPPNLNPMHYRWSMGGVSNRIVAIHLLLDVSPALLELLKLKKCGCTSARPCSTACYRCMPTHLSCSTFSVHIQKYAEISEL